MVIKQEEHIPFNLLSESDIGLQNCLEKVYSHSESRELEVNTH